MVRSKLLLRSKTKGDQQHISLTTWVIWKSRNKSTMNNEEITTIKAEETLKHLVMDLVRRSWNTTKYMEKHRKVIRQKELRSLWADKRLTNFDHKKIGRHTSELQSQ